MSTKFDKMIEIITAMKEGKKIQCRFANSMDRWTLTDMNQPNFQEYEYRIYHAMPKFRVALMFDADLDYYYTFTVNKESDEQALQETPKFINWVTPWITCEETEGTMRNVENESPEECKSPQRDRIVSGRTSRNL